MNENRKIEKTETKTLVVDLQRKKKFLTFKKTIHVRHLSSVILIIYSN